MKTKNGVELIVVDYLQLMRGTGKKAENRVNEITEISMGLKAIAKELEIPLIALSQLSRAVESRGDKRPNLSDLRDSGSIEQDADLVAFIYRPEYYDAEGKNHEIKGLAEFIIAKNRNGACVNLPLLFHGPTTDFREFDEEPTRTSQGGESPF